MKTMYRADALLFKSVISPVLVSSVGKSMVTVVKSPYDVKVDMPKSSDAHRYFDDWDEARKWLQSKARDRVTELKRQLRQAESILGDVEVMLRD
jgi:hypothetical protein